MNIIVAVTKQYKTIGKVSKLPGAHRIDVELQNIPSNELKSPIGHINSGRKQCIYNQPRPVFGSKLISIEIIAGG